MSNIGCEQPTTHTKSEQAGADRSYQTWRSQVRQSHGGHRVCWDRIRRFDARRRDRLFGVANRLVLVSPEVAKLVAQLSVADVVPPGGVLAHVPPPVIRHPPTQR